MVEDGGVGVVSRSWRAGFVALNLGQLLAHQTALSFSALMPILRNEWHLSASQAGLILGVFSVGQTAAYVAVGSGVCVAARSIIERDGGHRAREARLRRNEWASRLP